MSRKRTDYTHDDRVMIVQYIINRKGYTFLRGNTFWKEMEASNILKRTWQSLKQHFRTKIIHSLSVYGIPRREQENIYKGYMGTKQVLDRSKNTKTNPINVPQEEHDIDFSDEEMPQTSKCDRNMRPTSSSDSSPDISIAQHKKRKMIEKEILSNSEKENTRNNTVICSMAPTYGKGKTFKKQELKYKNKSKMPIMFAINNHTNNSIEDCVAASHSDNNMTVDLNVHSTCPSSNDMTEMINLVTPGNSVKSEDDRSTVFLNLNSPCVSEKSDDDPAILDFNATSSSSLRAEEMTVQIAKEFSREEEQDMIEYFRNDLAFFKHVNDLRIYNLFKETTKNSRTSEELMDHFVKNVFPVLYHYDGIEDFELLKIYKIAGWDIFTEDVNGDIAIQYNEKLDAILIYCDGQPRVVLKDCDEKSNRFRRLLIKQKFPNISEQCVLLDSVKYNTLRISFLQMKKHREEYKKRMKNMNLSDLVDTDFYVMSLPRPVNSMDAGMEIKEEQFDSEEVNLSTTPNVSQSVSQISSEIPIQPQIISHVIRNSDDDVDIEIKIEIQSDEEFYDEGSSSESSNNLPV